MATMPGKSFGHLIKRNPSLSGAKKRFFESEEVWFVQTKKNGNPIGWRANRDEKIYLYETGYAVWAEGSIVETSPPIPFFNINDLLSYASPQRGQSSFKSIEYWGRIIIDVAYPFFSSAKQGEYFSVFEVRANMQALKEPIPLPKNLTTGRSSWLYLKEPIEKLRIKLELDTSIPTSLRRQVFDVCSLDPSNAYYDIDHFVPKSIGGPGNIIENLQPIGSSINRTKSDDVPSSLFDVASAFGISTTASLSKFRSTTPVFLSTMEAKNAARLLISQVNKMKIDLVKSFYREVRRRHRPAFDFLHS